MNELALPETGVVSALHPGAELVEGEGPDDECPPIGELGARRVAMTGVARQADFPGLRVTGHEVGRELVAYKARQLAWRTVHRSAKAQFILDWH